MNNIVNLFKLSIIMLFRGDTKKKSKIKKPLIFILIFISVIPLMSSFVFLSKEVYIALEVFNQGSVVLALSFAAGSLVVLTFGIFYTISSYYMAKDVVNYLYLPLKPEEIIVSRFLITLLYEYLTLFIFVLPIIIGCGIGGEMGFVYYFFSIIVFLILPILPLSIASIIIIILMSFSKKSLNKDRFTLISGLIGLAIGLGLNFSLQTMFSNIDDSAVIQELIISGQFDMVEKTTSYFPGIKNATYAVNNGDILQLLIFLGIAIVAFGIFVYIAKKLYFKGVIGINQQSAKRDFTIDNDKIGKSKNSTIAYAIKELKLIFRTPIYFMNLALMDYLMPIILVFAFASSGNITEISNTASAYLANTNSYGILLSGTFALFIFISSMNGITATCISREGRQLYIMKFLPIPIKAQINAKLLSGLIVSAISMLIVAILIIIVLKIELYIAILMIIVGFNAVIFTRLSGLFIDLINPKLNWDSEVKAVKQNMNILFNMLVGMAIAGVAIVLSIVFKMSSLTAILVLIVGVGLLNYLVYRLINRKAYSWLMKVG